MHLHYTPTADCCLSIVTVNVQWQFLNMTTSCCFNIITANAHRGQHRWVVNQWLDRYCHGVVSPTGMPWRLSWRRGWHCRNIGVVLIKAKSGVEAKIHNERQHGDHCHWYFEIDQCVQITVERSLEGIWKGGIKKGVTSTRLYCRKHMLDSLQLHQRSLVKN